MRSFGTAKISYVRVTDEKGLKEVGCPWSPNTLRQYHYLGKYPDLFSKVGGSLMLDVDEMKKLLKKGKGKAPTGA